jgi:hypothetical protein
MRAENRSDGASGEILKSVLQIISRQYEKRSRSLIVSVDHETIPASMSSENPRILFFAASCALNQFACAVGQDDIWPWCVYNRAVNDNCDLHHNVAINLDRRNRAVG